MNTSKTIKFTNNTDIAVIVRGMFGPTNDYNGLIIQSKKSAEIASDNLKWYVDAYLYDPVYQEECIKLGYDWTNNDRCYIGDFGFIHTDKLYINPNPTYKIIFENNSVFTLEKYKG